MYWSTQHFGENKYVHSSKTGRIWVSANNKMLQNGKSAGGFTKMTTGS
jgi:hypothetical protein